ncbi:MAG: hypothetical protein YFSK_4910 [Candidatus Yanofskyibacterium parasiticum]|nr:MAG: hypothetical protein YFSK_4910 [Candidatus Yanofskybacteria bacterium]
MEKNYRLPAILCALAVCLALGFAVAAWNSPAGTPPAGNIATPINTGTAAQTKAGDLNLGGKLSVASDSAAGRFCLDGQCCSSWPECTAFGGGSSSCKLTPMSDVLVDGYDKYQCKDDCRFFICSYNNYWCPANSCVIASDGSQFFFWSDGADRRLCAGNGYELLIEDSSQYNYTDECTPDGGAALSNFTAGLYVCNNGAWVKTSD